MFTLVIFLYWGTGSGVVIPSPYNNLEECTAAGEVSKATADNNLRYVCVPLKPLKED